VKQFVQASIRLRRNGKKVVEIDERLTRVANQAEQAGSAIGGTKPYNPGIAGSPAICSGPHVLDHAAGRGLNSAIGYPSLRDGLQHPHPLRQETRHGGFVQSSNDSN
jgi:hypothetical protein